MSVPIRADLQKLIDEQIRSGQYATPEDVIRAGLLALEQHESFGDFAPDELEALIAEGEQSVTESGTLDAEEAYRTRRALRTGIGGTR
jgi:putative addiction module CopG family antidote